MAASMGKDGSDSESEPQQCEETNVLSPQFDALRAIHDTNIQLPYPEAKPFEDISKFLSHYNRLLDTGKVSRPSSSTASASLGGSSGTDSGNQNINRTRRQNDPSKRQGTTKSVSRSDRRKSAVPHESRAGTSSSKDESCRRRDRSVFHLMEDAEGPLSLLRWCFEKKQKARVCTRTFKGLRGVCIGYVVAFDKFLNLALSDVMEIYRKPPLGKKIYHQETLTVSKILQQFALSQKESKETPKKEKKKRNRKERKVRLEARLKAAGIFEENYHPPPEDREQSEIIPTTNQAVSTRSERAKVVSEKEEKDRSGESAERNDDGKREGKTDAPPQTGRDLIKPEEFHRRYVHQLFVKGDNVVLISVDKNR